MVGTNPFIISSEAEEGNRFIEILRQNPDIKCLLLNYGNPGDVRGLEGGQEEVAGAVRGPGPIPVEGR
ncbi:MAG TPA: hypothetical protein EYP17_10985 [Candidatus Latescibacteria bacterium]|nr:hypothetical protein [Candidatus Latescibacterota bacterium]